MARKNYIVFRYDISGYTIQQLNASEYLITGLRPENFETDYGLT
jgi:hypothetical protein